MRLTPDEVNAIKQSVREADPEAAVYLFGSRVDDTKRGGDIDLLVISRLIGLAERISMKLRLYDRLGERKIDLIVTPEPRRAFEKLARAQGVRL